MSINISRTVTRKGYQIVVAYVKYAFPQPQMIQEQAEKIAVEVFDYMLSNEASMMVMPTMVIVQTEKPYIYEKEMIERESIRQKELEEAKKMSHVPIESYSEPEEEIKIKFNKKTLLL